VRLIQGLPKGDKMDLILQKGTELGISRFTPLLSGRSVPRLNQDRRDNRRQRWLKIIEEASRQSRRPCLPRLDEVETFDEVLKADEGLKLLLWEETCQPLAQVLPTDPPGSAALLVGPEGGFAEAEVARATQAGFVPVSLGPRILRTETAGFTLAAILQYLYGDIGHGCQS
jgi:16S rRNA (uracil1498-N3)-methyltransferase